MILIVGDIHAEYSLFFERVAKLDPQPTAILQVGDLGGEDKKYPDFPIPTYFIQGNHENWYLLYGDGHHPLMTGKDPKNLHQISNGGMAVIEDLLIVGLGGNYSSKFYPLKREKIQGGRRRHFTADEVQSCSKLAIDADYEMRIFLGGLQDVEAQDPMPPFHGIDILLTHEAPSPYVNRGRNCGIGQINEAIRLAQPKLHFFGHHHYDGEYEYEGVKSYGLGMGFKTGVLLDPKTLEVKRKVLY